MLRRFARDVGWYAGAGVLARSVTVLLLPLYTRNLGPSAFGLLDYLLAAANVLVILVGLELAQGHARYYPEQATDEDRSRYASSAWWCSFALYSAGAVALVALAPRLSALLPDGATTGLIDLAVLMFWTTALSNVLLAQLRYAAKVRRAVAASLAGALTNGLASAYALLVLDLGVAGVLVGTVAGNIVLGGLSYLGDRGTITRTVDRAALRDMLRFGVPLLPSSLGVLASLYVDRIVVAADLGSDQLGVYAVAMRLATVVVLVTAPVTLAVTPLIYRHRDDDGAARAISGFGRLVLISGAVLAVATELLAREVSAVAAGAAYDGEVEIIGLLVFSLLCGSLYVFAPGLAIAHRSHVMSIVNVAAGLVNLAGTLWLVPVFGLVGAAAVTTASSVAMYVGFEVLGRRHYDAGVGLGWVAGASAIVLLAAVMTSAQRSHAWLPFGVRIALTAVVVVVGLVSARQVISATGVTGTGDERADLPVQPPAEPPDGVSLARGR